MAKIMRLHGIPTEVVRTLPDLAFSLIYDRPVYDLEKLEIYFDEKFGTSKKSSEERFTKLFGNSCKIVEALFIPEK